MSKYVNVLSSALKYAAKNQWNAGAVADATMHGHRVEQSLRKAANRRGYRGKRVVRKPYRGRKRLRGAIRGRRLKYRGGRTGLKGKQRLAFSVMTKTVPPQVFRMNLCAASYGARGRCQIGSLDRDINSIFLTGAQSYTMNMGIVPPDIKEVYNAASVKPTLGVPVYWGPRQFTYLMQNQQNTTTYMEVYVGTYRRDQYGADAPANANDWNWRESNEMISLGNWNEGGLSITNPGAGAPQAATPFENKLLVTNLRLKKMGTYTFRPGETKRFNFKQSRVFVDNGYIGYQALAAGVPLNALRGVTKTLILKVWGEPGYEITTSSQANNAKISSTRPMFAYQCLKQYTIYYQQTPSTILPRELVNTTTGAFTSFGSMTENTPANLPALL